MFTINGNLKEFTQWEQGYSLTNPNMKAGDKVQFYSGSGESSIMKAKEVDGVVLVEVPNILLGYEANITAQLVDNGERTTFAVKAAPKPAGGWKPVHNEPKKGIAKVEDGVVCDEDGNVVAAGGSGGSGAEDFVVEFTTVDFLTATSDKTFEEIKTAYKEGKNIKAYLMGDPTATMVMGLTGITLEGEEVVALMFTVTIVSGAFISTTVIATSEGTTLSMYMPSMS